MDPAKPDSFNHRTEALSTGRTYHFVDQRPEKYDPAKTPTILCIHGFPDLWCAKLACFNGTCIAHHICTPTYLRRYGWRYQIGPWVRAGYRVLAPDMLGYGGTDKLTTPVYYSIKRLCDDLAALLDVIDVRRAVIAGHDWGSAIAWRFALYHPERILALVT